MRAGWTMTGRPSDGCMEGSYIVSGSAVYFSLSRAITRMAADITREVEVGSEEAARTTKYYFTKTSIVVFILCSHFILICCTYIDTNYNI